MSIGIGGFNILCLIRWNESLVPPLEHARKMREDAGNGRGWGELGKGRMRGTGNGRSWLWYRY